MGADPFADTSFRTFALDAALRQSALAIVDEYFEGDARDWCGLPDEQFRARVSQAQDRINDGGFVRDFCRSHASSLAEVIDEPIAAQTNCYLRVTRPKPGTQEEIGFHRETFYGPAMMQYSYNVWIPVKNVVEENSLSYVPMSHLIPEEDIRTESVSESESGVRRYSDGHRIGLLYSPKRIVGGVALDQARRMHVPDGQFAVFPGNLIHGNAVNRTDRIRFSIDFRFIATSRVTDNKSHFSSGRPYFEPVQAGD